MGLRTYLAIGALLIRVIAFANASYFFDRPELVSPVSNIKRLKEALFLEELGLSPYEGQAFHQAPIVLELFRIPVYLNLVSIACLLLDFWVAYLLKRITELYMKTAEAKRDSLSPPPASLPDMVFFLYLYLPFSWMACTTQSLGLLDNLIVAGIIFYALKGNLIASVVLLSFATYLSLYPIQLLVPVLYLFPKSNRFWVFTIFALTTAGLWQISFRIVGSWEWVMETYGFLLHVTDLTPNIGLFWYFFLEIFEHFRTFFCCVLQLNCFLYVIPLGIALKKRPTLLFWMLIAFVGTLKPYPSVADLALQFGLLPLFYPLIEQFLVRFFVLAQVYVYAGVAMPIVWYVWLYQGSGNANFYYGATLAISCAQIWLIIEMLHIALERLYKLQHSIAPFDSKVKLD